VASNQVFSEQNKPHCDEIGQALVVRPTVDADETLVPDVAENLHGNITCRM